MSKEPEAERIEQTVVRNLIELREERGWSQTELARRMTDLGWPKYTQMTVSRTEKGERPIRLDEAKSLADAFGIDMDFLWLPKLERRYVGLLTKVERAEEELQQIIAAYLQCQFDLAVVADVLSLDEEEQLEVADLLIITPEAITQRVRASRLEHTRSIAGAMKEPREFKSEREQSVLQAFWDKYPADERPLLRLFDELNGAPSEDA